MTSIRQKALQHFGNPRGNSRGGLEALYICPQMACGDTKGKLSLNLSTGGFRCWRCGYNGFVQGVSDITPSELSKMQQQTSKVPTLEEHFCVPVEVGDAQYSYLKDVRGLSDDLIRIHDFRKSLLGPYKGRLIIPIYDNGYKGFQTRWLDDDHDPRYLSCKGLKRSQLWHNMDRAVEYPEIIVTEGIFSSIAAGPNAVSGFGKNVTIKQAQRLAQVQRRLIICLDGGVVEETLKLMAMLFSMGVREVEYLPLPDGKDPDDLGSEFQDRMRRDRMPVNRVWLQTALADLAIKNSLGKFKTSPGFFDSIQKYT